MLYKVKNKIQHLRQLTIVLVILNILDIIFTKLAFNIGATEANPLMAFFLAKFGFIGLIFPKILFCAILIFIIFKYAKEKHYKGIRNCLYIGITPYVILTIYHIVSLHFWGLF